MILDQQTVIWEAAALTSSAYSTNWFDAGAIPSNGSADGQQPDPSIGEPLGLVLSVGVSADHTSGNETYEFDVTQSASSSDPSSSPDTLVQRVIDYSLLTAGAVVVIPIPPGSVTKRYIAGHYIGGGTTPTITVTGWIAPLSWIQRQAYYTTAIVLN